ncbi:BUD13 homolog [Strongylocentrotus purpuratus]|uniref:BUD13 homolog n=1 Tax=Strongylocentrotus purpuratus TaxID=7668 RepID=A0A7M7RFA2_STRPU|nr:BUD13 homolog [Strongylocentrotus purpuratus]
MSVIDQKEYLKRYLSGGDAEEKNKKKRKKKPGGHQGVAVKAASVRVLDDDVDFRTLARSDAGDDKSTLLEEADEAPLVADFIDERPEDEVKLEQYRKSDKWKVMTHDEEEEEELPQSSSIGGQRPRHDSSSDASPPRRRPRHDSGSDLSPPRGRPGPGQMSRTRHDSDSDVSPPRRRNGEAKQIPKGRHDSDPGLSPPRAKVKGSRRNRHDSDSDISPVRTKRKQGARHDSDSDISPPRLRRPSPSGGSRNSNSRTRHDSDSDLSPPRISNSKRRDQGPSKSGRSNRDLSPARRKGRGSDVDLSPPRRGGGGSRRRMDSDSDLSSDRGRPSKAEDGMKGKPKKTLSGAKAGLSDAAALRRENEATRRRTNEAYSRLDDDVSGKNADTIFRDKTGRRRDLKEEKRLKKEEEAKKAEEDEKFLEWGKGVAQVKNQKSSIEDTMREMAKPLARYKDDQDLDQMLKEQDRAGDPMLAFLKKKESNAMAKAGIKVKPKYRGPKPPPTRFNIQPGYRWDGVDRSSGFEKKYFQRMSDKKATSEIAYKWSIEDM